MDEWKCIKCSYSSGAWTLGRVYRTDEDGCLIDNDGDCRLPPDVYNELNYVNFERVYPDIENE